MFDILPFGILPDAAVVHEPDLTPDDLTDPPPVDTDPMDVSVFRAVEEVHPHLMFRSSIRDPRFNPDTPVRMTLPTPWGASIVTGRASMYARPIAVFAAS